MSTGSVNVIRSVIKIVDMYGLQALLSQLSASYHAMMMLWMITLSCPPELKLCHRAAERAPPLSPDQPPRFMRFATRRVEDLDSWSGNQAFGLVFGQTQI